MLQFQADWQTKVFSQRWHEKLLLGRDGSPTAVQCSVLGMPLAPSNHMHFRQQAPAKTKSGATALWLS